ncbi:selenide, water dikinase SelD [Mobilicoccus pelagius]|uniref:Selenide, water dikinase n=1 Tax=Mobilicoccus pelagius NBRC 104925 TaxID=1089455 RepID=H5URF6_9MICO|nr:selenide, water dikinase SelD [Mobilicoccus pelagius]GAB48314.1 selenophosphate synthase [Mobilicoccus pelagius NBRC 104925]
MPDTTLRLTQFAAGGGCACKLPAGQLESVVAGLVGQDAPDLLVGLDAGDDACAVRLESGSDGCGTAVISTADFFTPMIDSPYDWGRIAAANALSDVYAMGGRPVLAINLVGWPVDLLPDDVLTEVLRGGFDVGRAAGCPVAGGHSITAPEPIYGMAVTGVADPERLLRNDAAEAGLPISLTKPIGVGLLNNRHKATGERFEEAVETMTTLNDAASRAALDAGVRAATDVTGFGLLGHLHKMMRASGVTAVLDRAAVPVLDAARDALRDGFVPGGSRRNLDWVRPHLVVEGSGVGEDDLVLLADAQTSGGLLVVGEVPGAPVVGETVPAREGVTVVVR